LEENPHPKYFLSAKACQGILRRAAKRGKELPPMLKEALIRQAGIVEEMEVGGVVPTLTGDHQNRVTDYTAICVESAVKVYGICSDASNSMKSSNPHSGIYEATTSRTLDLNGGSPACNQGGMAIVQSISGTLSVKWAKGTGGPAGDECQNLVVTQKRFGEYEPGISAIMTGSGSGKTGENLVVAGIDCRNGTENNELSATLQAKPGGGFSYNCTHPVRIGCSVRRLTPLECERLQDYPDGWTGHQSRFPIRSAAIIELGDFIYCDRLADQLVITR
jgi:hypothetical protein